MKPLWFAKSFYHRRYTLEESLELTRRSLERVTSLVSPTAQVFLLTAATKTGAQAERTAEIRHAYNAMCRAFCEAADQAHLVDLDALLLEEDFQDSDHYTRAGYFKIATCVNDFMTQARPAQRLSEVAAE